LDRKPWNTKKGRRLLKELQVSGRINTLGKFLSEITHKILNFPNNNDIIKKFVKPPPEHDNWRSTVIIGSRDQKLKMSTRVDETQNN
jgi:hypothetical protein